MFKLASCSILAASVFLPSLQAQFPSTGVPASVVSPQGQNTGIPASVVSPTADGRQHGIPASVVSPKPGVVQGVRRPDHHPVFGSRRPLRPFGRPGHRTIVVAVPLFYPAYGQTYDAQSAVTDPADPGSVDDAAADEGDNVGGENPGSEDDALRRAYLQGARDALARQADRYSKRNMDSPENARSATVAQNRTSAPSPAESEPEPDNSPGAVFIFKDGHQIETRNFAIMGQTLYDFSSNGLKKVQLSELDTKATQKANDDRGITVKLP